MQIFDTIASMGHEQVTLCHDPAAGYRGIIAIHSTVLGPALGGTRFWSYATDDEAVVDALRLARGMTYKNAVAGLNLGGGKSVIIGDNKTSNRELLFRAHGRFVESLGGRYITAEDVGTSTADMDYVHMETKNVSGLAGRSGDPSPVTAHGEEEEPQVVGRRIRRELESLGGIGRVDGRAGAVEEEGARIGDEGEDVNDGARLCRDQQPRKTRVRIKRQARHTDHDLTGSLLGILPAENRRRELPRVFGLEREPHQFFEDHVITFHADRSAPLRSCRRSMVAGRSVTGQWSSKDPKGRGRASAASRPMLRAMQWVTCAGLVHAERSIATRRRCTRIRPPPHRT